MPPVEEWSCLVTIEERMVRSEETTLAHESSHDVSMPRMSLGLVPVAVLMLRKDGVGRRTQAELDCKQRVKMECWTPARPTIVLHMLQLLLLLLLLLRTRCRLH